MTSVSGQSRTTFFLQVTSFLLQNMFYSLALKTKMVFIALLINLFVYFLLLLLVIYLFNYCWYLFNYSLCFLNRNLFKHLGLKCWWSFIIYFGLEKCLCPWRHRCLTVYHSANCVSVSYCTCKYTFSPLHQAEFVNCLTYRFMIE